MLALSLAKRHQAERRTRNAPLDAPGDSFQSDACQIGASNADAEGTQGRKSAAPADVNGDSSSPQDRSRRVFRVRHTEDGAGFGRAIPDRNAVVVKDV
nr:hypothetical protein CFP56_04203 [Quercus suber]